MGGTFGQEPPRLPGPSGTHLPAITAERLSGEFPIPSRNFSRQRHREGAPGKATVGHPGRSFPARRLPADRARLSLVRPTLEKWIMTALLTSLIAFAVIFGGTFLVMFVRGRLPDHRLSGDTKEVMRLGTGLVGTIAALLLG